MKSYKMKSLSSKTKSKGSRVKKVVELALIMSHERLAKIPTSKKNFTKPNLNLKMQIKKIETLNNSLMT